MSPELTAPTARPKGKSDISPAVFLLLIAFTNIIGPFIPVPNRLSAIIGGILLTIFYVGIVVGFALTSSKRRYPIGVALGGFAACAVVWLGIEYGLWPIIRPMLRAWRESQSVAPEIRQLIFYVTTALQDAAMVAGATFAGTILARLIRHPNMIGPIGAAIALIDIWGVLFGGIVSQLMANKATQPLAAKAMAAGPKMGAANIGHHGFSLDIPAIGVGDFLFMALLLSVLVNLAMKWRESARWMFALVCLALLAITLLPWFPALPGLLFIGGAAILPNLEYFRYTREENFALLYAGIFVAILTVGLYFGFKAALPPSPAPGQNRVDATRPGNS